MGGDTHGYEEFLGEIKKDIDSKVYRWNGTAFVEVQSLATHGARDWEQMHRDFEEHAREQYEEDLAVRLHEERAYGA